MDKYTIPHLEYNLTHACNLKCANCDHLAPYFSIKMDKEYINYDNFKSQLEILNKHAKINSFLFLGGEPILNRDILKYLKTVKDLGIAQESILITNGFLLPKMDEQAYRYLDRISVSIYQSKPLPSSLLKDVEKLCDKFNVQLEFSRLHHYFGYNVIGKEIENEWLVKQIFLTCSLAWKQHCHTLFGNKISRCSRLPFMNLKLQEAGCISSNFIDQDCLEIVDDQNFSYQLKQYLESQKPLQSCKFCLGSVGKRMIHKQLTKKEIESNSWAQINQKGLINWFTLYRRILKLKLLKRI